MIDPLSYMITELCNRSPSFAKKYSETIDDFVEAQTDYLNHIRKSKHAVKRRERLIWKPINRTMAPKRTKKKGNKIYPQVGKSVSSQDSKFKAKLPGHRISKSGSPYFENRKNRSDTPSERKFYDSRKRTERKTSNRKKFSRKR